MRGARGIEPHQCRWRNFAAKFAKQGGRVLQHKRAPFFAALAAAIALFALAALPSGAAASSYEELLAQAKSNSATVDLRALREAYAESAQYNPYDSKEGGLRSSMVDAFNRHDCNNAMKYAQAILDSNYVDIDSHTAMERCYRSLDKPLQSRHHGLIARGLLAAVMATGDGKSPKTAFVVISIAEEYAVLGRLGLRKTRQAIKKAEDHRYDLMTVTNKSGGTENVFFQIDRLYSWWMKNNQKPQAQ
jgi:hypothetical protein